MALAREKLSWEQDDAGPASGGDWIVARVCSEYLQYCERGVAGGTISKSHLDNAKAWLNDLCTYCGALSVGQLKKGHVQKWIDSHESWRSPATHGGVISVVLAAFNRAEEMFGIPSPLKGLKKPKAEPRLASFSPDEERLVYSATDEPFGNFLFAAIHTGLRPFCELARLNVDDIVETERGLMWRIASSKTKKTRKIPIRSGVAELKRRLLAESLRDSVSTVFRNVQGRPWKKVTGVHRFLKIKRDLNWEQDPVRSRYSCYTCRHTFAHRMLAGYWNDGVGCSIEVLAELMGDTPQVAFDHYGREWGQHFQEPLWAALGLSQQV